MGQQEPGIVIQGVIKTHTQVKILHSTGERLPAGGITIPVRKAWVTERETTPQALLSLHPSIEDSKNLLPVSPT